MEMSQTTRTRWYWIAACMFLLAGLANLLTKDKIFSVVWIALAGLYFALGRRSARDSKQREL